MVNDPPVPAVYTHPADIALAEFGYDPWQIECFLNKTPAERLAWLGGWSRWIGEIRRRNGR